MSIGPVLVMLAATALAFGAVHVYERLLATVRAERDELLDVLDDHVEDMIRSARDRHPSQQYGGGNLRLVK